jgi:hypothetical protein
VRTLPCAFLLSCLLCVALHAQVERPKGPFMPRGIVQHHGNSATTLADDPRPLLQAVTAVSEEYGWVVDFEDPPYESDADLVDDTAPQWRARHPGEKGFRIVAGGAFQSNYSEKPNTATSPVEERLVLNKIVSDYNASGNPGKFVVRKQSDGSYAVVGNSVKDDNGNSKSVSSVLDTPISIPSGRRDVLTTIGLILDAVSSSSGIKILAATMPMNVLIHSQVTIGGENVSARNLLLEALAGTKRTTVWQLLYDADNQTYYLNIIFAKIAQYDTSGKRTTVPIDRLPHAGHS